MLLYLSATIASGCAWNFWSFALFRFLTGAGIGGEYAAVNATIQELIPARKRGFTDLCINGSFWLGAALGAVGASVALDPGLIDPGVGLAAGLRDRRGHRLRRAVPAPLHPGKPTLADDARRAGGGQPDRERNRGARGARRPARHCRRCPTSRCGCGAHHGDWFLASLRVLVRDYRKRTILGCRADGAQAFCYNAVLFTYALMLTQFYHVPGQLGRLVHAAVRAR